MKSLIFLSVLSLIFGCGKRDSAPDPVAPDLYFPPATGTWETIPAATLGWDESKISGLETFLETSNTRGFIILKDGKIVMEKYWGKMFDGTTDFSATSNWYWASAGKTLTSATVGIAAFQGDLNLDARTSDYLGTGWTSLTLAQENKITLRHQLTMTTGLNDAVANRDCTEPSCMVYLAEPGTRWAYHNAPYTILDEVIEGGTGKSLNVFTQEVLLSKIGMNGTYIKIGDNNVFFSTPRSMARFGLLLLGQGRWAQEQIITPSYMSLMQNPSQNFNFAYGYLTWLNGSPSYMIPTSQTVFPGAMSSNAPEDMFAAIGKNGQLINIVPSQNLVIIRMGDDPDNALVPFTFQDNLWEKLNAIITQ